MWLHITMGIYPKDKRTAENKQKQKTQKKPKNPTNKNKNLEKKIHKSAYIKIQHFHMTNNTVKLKDRTNPGEDIYNE